MDVAAAAKIDIFGCKQTFSSLLKGREFESCLKQTFFVLPSLSLKLNHLNVYEYFKRLASLNELTYWFQLHLYHKRCASAGFEPRPLKLSRKQRRLVDTIFQLNSKWLDSVLLSQTNVCKHKSGSRPSS